MWSKHNYAMLFKCGKEIKDQLISNYCMFIAAWSESFGMNKCLRIRRFRIGSKQNNGLLTIHMKYGFGTNDKNKLLSGKNVENNMTRQFD